MSERVPCTCDDSPQYSQSTQLLLDAVVMLQYREELLRAAGVSLSEFLPVSGSRDQQPAPASNGHQPAKRPRKPRRKSSDTMKTTIDAAEYLGIGQRTLIKLRDKGAIPCVYLSDSAVGYRVADLDAYLQKVRSQHDQKQGRRDHRTA